MYPYNLQCHNVLMSIIMYYCDVQYIYWMFNSLLHCLNVFVCFTCNWTKLHFEGMFVLTILVTILIYLNAMVVLNSVSILKCLKHDGSC